MVAFAALVAFAVLAALHLLMMKALVVAVAVTVMVMVMLSIATVTLLVVLVEDENEVEIESVEWVHRHYECSLHSQCLTLLHRVNALKLEESHQAPRRRQW